MRRELSVSLIFSIASRAIGSVPLAQNMLNGVCFAGNVAATTNAIITNRAALNAGTIQIQIGNLDEGN